MPDDQIPVTVSLNCKKCGNLGVTFPDDPSHNAIITCPAGGGGSRAAIRGCGAPR
jgi:hypothetical protein